MVAEAEAGAKALEEDEGGGEAQRTRLSAK